MLLQHAIKADEKLLHKNRESSKAASGGRGYVAISDSGFLSVARSSWGSNCGITVIKNEHVLSKSCTATHHNCTRADTTFP